MAYYGGLWENSSPVYQLIEYWWPINETVWDLLKPCGGGEGGIRTREKLAPLRDFQSRPFVHSGTSPREED